VTPAELRYARSSGVNGTSPESWQVQTLDATGNVNQNNISLAVVAARPAVGFSLGAGQGVAYLYGSDADGGTWGARQTVDGVGVATGGVSLTEVNGLPGLSYRRDTDFCFILGTAADGSAWGAPVVVDAGNASLGDTSLALIGGNPAFSFHDFGNSALRYARCSFADGGSTGADWSVADVETNSSGFFNSLIEFGGNPCIGFPTSGLQDAQMCAVANDGVGGVGSWTALQTVQSTSNGTASACSCAIVNGRFGMCYQDRSSLTLYYAEYH
jgi:hypothetical protein